MVSEVSIEMVLGASPGELFKAFTDPSRMRLWMGGAVDADPRVGGRYRIEIGDGDEAFVHAGSFTVVEPTRIVRTLRAGPRAALEADRDGAPTDEIEVLLQPVSGDQTRLTFINRWQSGALDAEGADAVRRAWIDWMSGLDAAIKSARTA